jgi:hypothetical protein
VTGDLDRNALQKVLGDLETRLEAYLVEWRRQLGLQERTEASFDRNERRQAAAEREKKGVETPAPKIAGVDYRSS